MFLIVISDFAGWTRGQAITDAADIAAALAEHPEKVLRVGADAAPAVSHAEPEHAPEE